MGDRILSVLLDCIAMLGLGAIGYQILIASRKRRLRSEQSMHWPNTQGVVIGSSIKRHDRMGSAGSYETAHIRYEYTVHGKKYKSSRFSFDDLEKMAVTEERLRSILEKYPKGRELTVYYDPQDPASAILYPKVTRARVVRIYTIVGWVSSAVGLFFAIKLIMDLLQ